MDRIVVGVIGAGQQGARHISTYQRLEQAELVAVADPSPGARRAALAGAPIAEYDDWRELLEVWGDSLDAVSVACPSDHHAEVAEAALELGLHVLVEKPIATSLAAAVRLTALARENGCKLMIGHIERFNPAITKMRAVIAEGRLGRVFRAHGTRIGPSPMRNLNAGVALDLATHDLDAMEFVLRSDLSEIYAQGGRFQHGLHEDLLTCLLRFESGALGLLDVNWLTPEKQRELVVIGEAGMLRASYITQDLWFMEAPRSAVAWEELATFRGDGEGSALRFALRKVEPIRAELSAFLGCIADDLPEPVSGFEGTRALASALAVLESAAQSVPVRPVVIGLPARRTLAPLESVA